MLTWIAYIGGPRESRRIMGDVVLTQEDIVSKRDFPDGCVPSTWSIDLHYPKKQYAEKFSDNPFISIAVHDRSVDRSYGYPVPYRCFYSKDVENLFMAGRNISVTHEALGTTRVMKTCGMMGEVVGRAASVCKLHECNPRDVYDRYLPELLDLLRLPGKARRSTVYETIEIPDDAMELAGAYGPPPGIKSDRLPGIVIDDRQAKKTGKWTEGQGLKGFVDYGYLYSSDPKATITFPIEVPKNGTYDIRLGYLPHENRGTQVKVVVTIDGKETATTIDMTKPAPLDNSFISLGEFELTDSSKVSVTMFAKGANGNSHADAVQVLEAK